MDKHEINASMARKAIYDLQQAHNNALVAHYTERDSTMRIISLDDLYDHFRRAAAHLGFTLTPIEGSSAIDGTQEAHHVTASNRDPDSGRPSLVEPAATSELSHNFGG